MTRLFLSMMLVFAVAQTAVATPIVINSGFEDPALTPVFGGFHYATSSGALLTTGVTGWTFGASGGESHDGIADPLAELPTGWTGGQAALLEGTGWCSQKIGGFELGTATITFQAAGRNVPGYGGNGVKVLLDERVLSFGINAAESVTPVDGVLGSYTTNSFDVTAGTHTITLAGTIPFGARDCTVFLDNVGITNVAVPEPTVMVLLTSGLLGLIAYACRKRK